MEWSNIRAGQDWAEGVTTQAVGSDVRKLSPEKEKALQLCSTYPTYGINVLSLRLHPSELIRWLETALTAARKLDDRGNEGNALGNLGIAYHSLGEYRKAIEFQEQHLAIAREIGDRRGEGIALFNMGLAFNEIKKRAKAIDYAKSGLKIFEQIESPAADTVRRQLAEWQG